MSNTAREDLHALNDPYADLDRVDPFVDMAEEERARLHASLQRAEDEIAAGKSTPAEDLVREVRAGRSRSG